MNTTIPTIPAEFVMPLNMNGMTGRMVRLPAPKNKKREILLIYGHHASLERLYGFAQALNDYGAVTFPDLPGFGGMDSFYKIGEKPSLDNMADYLASFIKLRYKNRRITIVGFSFGFLVVTKMLQKYPEIVKKVDLLISAVGFAHHEDLVFSKSRHFMYRWSASIFSNRIPAFLFKNIALNPVLIKTFYAKTHNAKAKFADYSPEQFKSMIDFEVILWRCNDVRTYMDTSVSLLTINNCDKQIDLPIWHIGVKNDNYFNNHYVEQHFRIIFNDFHVAWAKLNKHSVSVIADKKEAFMLIPNKIRKQLNIKI